MSLPEKLGGIVHTYQRYDPVQFPSPTHLPGDLVTPAFEHLLEYGDLSELSPEELARAVKLDPSQISGLGPTIESLKEMLRQRKAKILSTYETSRVVSDVKKVFLKLAQQIHPPRALSDDFKKGVANEQLRDLERLWYRSGDERSRFARQLVLLIERLAEKYQIDELASKYAFTGRSTLTVPHALEIKDELETIDRLLKQLDEAASTAQIGLIDLDELSQFASKDQLQGLSQLQQQVSDLIRQLAEQQGIEKSKNGYELTPQAFRLFQSKLLERIFSDLQASRSGRHLGPIYGEGAVELTSTRAYEFGDSIAHMDIPQTLINTMLRTGPNRRLQMKPEDIVIHKTRNSPKCATAVLMDMSGSMRHNGQYINVKRMALALQGLIQKEYPGDFLQFVEMYSVAKLRHASELPRLMPKPVTIHDPVVRLRADMSRSDLEEWQIPPHFTNIQHALQLARQTLGTRSTPNRQILLITDGLPTAHYEGQFLYLLYPSDPATEMATMREAMLCKQAGIVINLFLLASWSQSARDVRFAHQLAETTQGRVFFTAGRDLERCVVWDYVNRQKSVIG